jgi:hypothetical protein
MTRFYVACRAALRAITMVHPAQIVQAPALCSCSPSMAGFVIPADGRQHPQFSILVSKETVALGRRRWSSTSPANGQLARPRLTKIAPSGTRVGLPPTPLMVERWRLLDRGHARISGGRRDPKVLTAPWTTTITIPRTLRQDRRSAVPASSEALSRIKAQDRTGRPFCPAGRNMT